MQIKHDVLNLCRRAALLTAAQLKAARALVGMEQKALSQASGVSLPTIQRMEASNGTVRGVIESLTRVIAALEAAGVEFIYEGTTSSGGGRAPSTCQVVLAGCRRLAVSIEVYCQPMLQISAQTRNFWVLKALCSAAVT